MSNKKTKNTGKEVSQEEPKEATEPSGGSQNYTNKNRFANLSDFETYKKRLMDTKAKKTKRTDVAKDILNEKHLSDPESQKEYIKKVVDKLGDNKELIKDLYDATEKVIEEYGFKEELFTESVGDEIDKVEDLDEFTNYVYSLYKEAHGEEFSKEEADEFISDTVERATDDEGNVDWATAVGIAKKSLAD